MISHVLMYSYCENEDKTVKLDPVLAKRWSKQQARVSPTKLEIFGAGWHCRTVAIFPFGSMDETERRIFVEFL